MSQFTTARGQRRSPLEAVARSSATAGWFIAESPVQARGSESVSGIEDSSTELVDVRFVPGIFCGRREFKFSKPELLITTLEDGVWSVEFSELGPSGYGITRDEAEEVLQCDFLASWDGIAQQPDDLLTADAIELKRRLLDIAKEV